MNPELELVFVYGTLRNGGSNHFRMNRSMFVSHATVRGNLYQVEWYPALILDAQANPVIGEVYAIDQKLLESLDAYEGHEYRRIKCNVETPTGNILNPWMWEWTQPIHTLRCIESGDWLGADRIH